MGVVNKRNALLGWVVWRVGKRAAKRKAKGAVPGRASSSRRIGPAVMSGLAAAGGALWFWRRRRNGSGESGK